VHEHCAIQLLKWAWATKNLLPGWLIGVSGPRGASGLMFLSVPNENAIRPRMTRFIATMRAWFLTFAAILERTGAPLSAVRQISNRESAVARSRFGLLRRPVVHSGDAARPPAEPPRLAQFPAAVSIAVRASPSPTKDAFSIGDSTRNKR
jgi:hypothetical protein